MAELLKHFDCCVDATHPYAAEASQNIRTACQQVGVPLRRLLRGESSHQEGHWVDSPEEAARWLAEHSGNVLLAIGAKGLSAFQDLDRERLYPRVLPVVESIQACQAADIPTRNIIALHGPFSQELNCAMLKQYHIRYLVTKDGGRAGGLKRKPLPPGRSGRNWWSLAVRPRRAKPWKKFYPGRLRMERSVSHGSDSGEGWGWTPPP